MITLLKYFPWISTDTGEFYTPWVHYPEQLGDCEFVIVVETHNVGTADILLQTSTDGATDVDSGLPVAVNAVGQTVNSRDVIGTMVRLKIASTGAALMTFSVYVVPKQS
jgi:hypothetical protein